MEEMARAHQQKNKHKQRHKKTAENLLASGFH